MDACLLLRSCPCVCLFVGEKILVADMFINPKGEASYDHHITRRADMHRIIQEAFRELGHRTYQPFEDWAAWAIQRTDCDPSLFFLVFDGEEPIGAVLGFDQGELGGWVRQLAILKPWQGRGIGKQVLRHIFGEFYRRGARRAGLMVDSKNPGGATYFYQRAGMYVASQVRWYCKKIG